MKTSWLILFFICSVTIAKAKERFLPLSDFKFNGITAQYQDDTTTVYSLVCNGTAKGNTDSLIKAWLAVHPDATVRPVCSFSYYNDAGNRVTFTYVWLVSNAATDPSLNIFLIKNGSSSMGNMLWAKSPTTLQPSIDYYKKKKSETKVFIDKATYKAFVRNLQRAHARKKITAKK